MSIQSPVALSAPEEGSHAESRGDDYRQSPPDLAQSISRLIHNGEFRPGDHLGAVELAARFGVSRGPVREALRLLESRHLVRIVPQKGAFVTALQDDEAREVMAIREVLFGRLAEFAAERAEENHFADMDKELAALELLAQDAQTQPAVFQRATYRFIGVMHRAAKSLRLTRLIRDLSEGLGDTFGHLSMATQDMRLAEFRNYQSLNKLIKDRDVAKAGQQARRMHAIGSARARELQALFPASGEVVLKGRRRRPRAA